MDLLPHSLTHSVEEGGTSAEDNVLEKVFPDINITFLNRVIAVLMDTLQVETGILRLNIISVALNLSLPMRIFLPSGNS